MENLGHRERDAYVLHGLPGQGRPVELPVGGMPITSGDEDVGADTFYAPA